MSSFFFVNPRSNPELKSLFEISMLSQLQSNLQDYFARVMIILSEHFPIEYSALVLHDLQKDSLRVEGLYGVDRENHPTGCKGQRGTIGKVLESKRPMTILNLQEEPLYEEIVKEKKSGQKIAPPLICVPLLAEDETIGVMNINSLYGPRNELNEDYQFLSILSSVLSPVIRKYQRKKLHNQEKSENPKTKSLMLEDLLRVRLVEVLNRVDPYVEAKGRMSLLDDVVSTVEKIMIKLALERMGNVQVAAAELLGINRNTLRKKMKDLKIKTDKKR